MEIIYPEHNEVPADVILNLRKGSEQAFKVIFDHYYERLLNYAGKICYTAEHAEDVVQEVFISLWEHRGSLTKNEVAGWLIRVCRNKAIKSLRGQIIMMDVTEISHLQHSASDGLQQLHCKEVEQLIATVIEALPPMRRKIFLLSRESGMSYQKIADQLGISVKTVEAQMSSALRQLRTQITPFAYTLLLILLRQY